MDLKSHALHSLNLSRTVTQSILDQFQSDEDWMYQSHPKANHALWIAGHLALADNLFASSFRPETDHKPDGFEEVFWFGSEISSDASIYPARDEVIAYMKDRRENLLKVIEDLSDEELNAPAPPEGERSPAAGAPSIGHIFLFAAFHEGMHTGQLSVAHRGIGHPPLFQPQPAEAES